jgi:hypothetical protein
MVNRTRVMEGNYSRPVLCRLCGCPAVDGGVRVSELDADKLRRWCLRMMDTELDQEGLQDARFCDFCLDDAE